MSYWSNHDPENFSRELDRAEMIRDKKRDEEWHWYETEMANAMLNEPQNLFVVNGNVIEGKSLNQL